jgi:uncharacterized protein
MRSKGQIIDAWMQHVTPSFIEHPMFDSLRRWSHGKFGSRGEDTGEEIPLDSTIRAMDEGGIRRGMCCAWWGPVGPMLSNEQVAGFVRQCPERLTGIASLDLSRPMDAVRELRLYVRQHQFRGVRILPWLWGLPPDDRRYYPIYSECVELGIPFCTQVGHTGPLRSSEPGRPIPYLDNVALDFPELKIVGGHIGFPWVNEMISLAMKYPNVYIDTSAYKVKRYPPELVEYLRGHGRSKVLFGSNYPAWPAADCLGGLDDLRLDAETEALFLYRNAMKVFGLEESS